MKAMNEEATTEREKELLKELEHVLHRIEHAEVSEKHHVQE
jgi:hypothetical protein